MSQFKFIWQYETFCTEVAHPCDSPNEDFGSAIEIEIHAFIKDKTCKVVCHSEGPDNANILGGRFVLSMNDPATNKKIYKARFVFQLHKKFVNILSFTKFLLLVNCLHECSLKFPQYLDSEFSLVMSCRHSCKSAEALNRNRFVKPCNEFELGRDTIFMLLKTLYGLSKSEDYRGRQFRNHLFKDIDSKSFQSSPVLKTLRKRTNGNVSNAY